VTTSANMTSKASRFAAMHVPGRPLLMPNPWDAGSARLLASMGFEALATTSGGFAATLGRLDYSVTREEALANAATIVSAVDVPVSADLENCFADDPDGVAETVEGAVRAGLAGCSVEDFTGRPTDPIYPIEEAARRVEAAAGVAHRGEALVLTARAENYLHGRADLADTIDRLRAYQDAGADVLYAPGLASIADIEAVVAALERPVNVLLRPGGPTVPELAEVGVARISVGGAFALVALSAVARAGRELLEHGTTSWLELATEGRQLAASAFDAGGTAPS
jgi:2-methylisocitrate lyase-like PEP mutase family enzyme